MTIEDQPRSVSEEAQALYESYREKKPVDEAESLTSLCREHPALADELQYLDQAFQKAQGLLARLGASSVSTSHDPDDSGEERVAPLDSDASIELFSNLIRDLSKPRDPVGYEVRGTVAVGGMGEILDVWDQRLRRTLAMKVFPVNCRDDMTRGGRRRVSRFLEEAQVAAQLKHPAILPVHDLGIDGQGCPYFTMPLVEGDDFQNIIERIHGSDEVWTLTRGLRILQRVCEAMAYAHSMGVMHRDLKPANIMVGGFGETYVMDWGLAKVGDTAAKIAKGKITKGKIERKVELDTLRMLLADETPQSPMMTIDGQIVGTPAYMAPEQASGRIDDVGPHSDVYAAGTILYQLLTGRRPYTHLGKTATPSQLIQEIQRRPPQPVAKLNPHVPAELIAICEKAMARDPADRYPNMQALATDLDAYLEQRVVHAYETGAWAEFRKWVKRNRVLAASVLAAVLAVIGGLGGVLWIQAAKKAELEDTNLKLEAAEDTAVEKMESLRQVVYFDNIAFVQQAYEQDNIARLKKILAECDPDLRNWEWSLFNHLSDTSIKTWKDSCPHFALSSTGDWFVGADLDWGIRICHISTGSEKGPAFRFYKQIASIDLSKDDNRILIGYLDDHARIFNGSTGALELVTGPYKGWGVYAHFFAEDKKIMLLTEGGARIVDAATGDLIQSLPPDESPDSFFTFSHDEKWFVSRNLADKLCLWDRETCRIDRELANLSDNVHGAFSPDGKYLATSGTRERKSIFNLWNLETFESILELTAEGLDPKLPVAFSPDNKKVAWGNNSVIKIVDRVAGKVSTVLRGHEDGIMELEFLPDGRLLSSGGRADRMIKLWDLSRSQSPVILPEHSSRVWSIRFTEDSRSMMTASADGEVRLWDLESREILARIQSGHDYLYGAELSPDGKELITAGKGGKLKFWDTGTGEMKECIEYGLGRLWVITSDSEGDGYLAGSPDGGFALMNRARSEAKLIETPIRGAEFSPSSPYFVTAGSKVSSGHITVWDKYSGEPLWSVQDQDALQAKAGLFRVRFSPDGKTIASTGESMDDRKIKLWNAETGELLMTIEAHHQRPDDIAFSPDGKRLFSVARNEAPAVWDTESGRLVCTLPCTPIAFGAVQVSPNGRYVVGGSAGFRNDGGRLLLWEVPACSSH